MRRRPAALGPPPAPTATSRPAGSSSSSPWVWAPAGRCPEGASSPWLAPRGLPAKAAPLRTHFALRPPCESHRNAFCLLATDAHEEGSAAGSPSVCVSPGDRAATVSGPRGRLGPGFLPVRSMGCRSLEGPHNHRRDEAVDLI